MLFTSRCLLSFRRLIKNQRFLTSEALAAPEKHEECNAEKPIIVGQNGSIRLFGINKPHKKNALNSIAVKELNEALNEFDEDEESKIGIIHGIGGNFSSGFDLDEIAMSEGDSDKLPHFGAFSTRYQLSKKPLIAAISGYAIGAGFELALMCDIRVIEDTSKMGFLNRRFGIPIMWGGTVRLPAMIGHSRAMDLILTGREIAGSEAYSWGLGARLVACGSGLGQSISIAGSILKYPQASLLADRTSMNYTTFGGKSIEEALEFEKENATDSLLDDGIEGAKRFVEGFGRHGKSTNIKDIDSINFRKLDNDLI